MVNDELILALYEDAVCGNCGSPLNKQGRCKQTERMLCGALNLPVPVNAVATPETVIVLPQEAYIFQPIF